MARARRRTMRRGNRGVTAGPFAGAVKNGRALSWESLVQDLQFPQLTQALSTNAFVVGTDTVRVRVILPHNLTRGVVTMLRVRGAIYNGYQQINLAGGNGNRLVSHAMNIQLVPVTNNTVVLDSVLDPRNPTDLESNRVLWRRTYNADLNATDGVSIGAVRRIPHAGPSEIDIKSKRRWDRALWSLLLVSSYDTVEGFDHRINLDLRGLFRASDGV